MAVAEGLSMGIMLPFIKCHMNITIYQYGLLNSSGFIGIFFGSHLWGLLADTWGRRKIIQITSLCSFLFALLSSASNNVWMLFPTRIFVGFL